MSTGTSDRYRLPRFKDTTMTKGSASSPSPSSRNITPMDVAHFADPLDPYDPPLPRTLVHSWESGPMLIANMTNKESSGYELPGEGKITRTLEEGSRVWKHKTRRTYHEDVKKEKQPTVQQHKQSLVISRSSATTPTTAARVADAAAAVDSMTSSRRKPLGDKLYYMPRTDDDKLVSTTIVSATDSYAKKPLRTPSPAPERKSYLRDTTTSAMKSVASVRSSKHAVHMQDKSVQCNLKKEKSAQKPFEISQDFKVIKSSKDGSVSAFSDVSVLEDPAKKKDQKVVYTQVETHLPHETVLTREYHTASKDKDYFYTDNPVPRGGVDRTVEVTKSRPLSRDGYSPSPTRTRVVTKTYGLNVGSEKYGPDVTPRGSPLMRSPVRPPINHWYYDQGERSRLEAESPSRARNLAHETIEETISISNASSDEMIEGHKEAHKQAVKTVTNDGKVDINANYKEKLDSSSRYRTPQPTHSLHRKRDPSSSPFGGDAHSTKSSVNSSPGMSGGPPGMWFKSIDSDYRRNMAKNTDVRENTIGIKDHDHFCSATMSRTNKRTTPLIDSNSVQSYTLDRKHLSDKKKKSGLSHSILEPLVHRRAPSLPEKERKDASFNSTMRRYNSTKDVNTGYVSDGNGYRKGGLAAAFQERQDRASSLNRTIERSYHGSDFALASRFDPRPRSRSVYESEPEVHYVPVKEPSSHVGRSHSILSSRRQADKASKEKDKKDKDKGNGVHFAAMSKEYSSNPSGEVMMEDKKGNKDLKRSQSIPKDTKFPWLNRFRMKVKAREP